MPTQMVESSRKARKLSSTPQQADVILLTQEVTLFRLKYLASKLSVNPHALYRLVKAKKFPAGKIGTTYFISDVALLEYLKGGFKHECD